jgi:GH15 family glucan-1,4-alpha-glucosidase
MKEDKEMAKKLERLVVKSADGISKLWAKDHFNQVTEDIWEERKCFPDLKENFMYSLAAVHKGLMNAYDLLGNEIWKEKAEEIGELLILNASKHVGRSFGLLEDNRIDASLLALIWPFDVKGMPKEILQNIVDTIEDKIVVDYGVYRYEHDEYDGWMYNKNIHRRKGAGYWPLLNFWMSVALFKLDHKEKALKYFYKVLDDLESSFIPEQIFNNEYQKAVSPLCWSHAMFLLAADELGVI